MYYKSIFKFKNEESAEEKCKISKESLVLNGNPIFLRSGDDIVYNNNPIIKLSPYISLINALKEENVVGEAYQALLKIRGINKQSIESCYFPFSVVNKPKSIEELKSSNLSSLTKLESAYNLYEKDFNEIKKSFINIFPRVEDLRFKTSQEIEKHSLRPVFQIKEAGVNEWISIWNISKGMLKTLMQLCNVFLSSKGSVILIDEVENSLGVNCMEAVFEEIRLAEDVQFIITSHHPYIINNIGPEHWKIVTRKGSTVSVKNADTIEIKHSRHEAFLQLINSIDFQG